MKTFSIIASALALGGAGAVAWATSPAAAPLSTGAAHAPVVVELFQSQGCSDCPPAQDNLNSLSDRPDVLALSFGVTYWDYLGWKDSFASPRFTDRQRDYSAHNGGAGVATPQYWINGRTTILGSNPARVAQAIALGGPTGGPVVAITGSKVSIGAGHGPSRGADVWLVRYDPRTIQVAVSAGENGGRTLPHRDIVRELTRIGRWTGGSETLNLPPSATAGLRTAILVQDGAGGPILAAAKG